MLTGSNPIATSWSSSPYKGLSEFFSKYGPKPQHFRINPLRQTVIVSEKGLRLTFAPFSFSDVFGDPVKTEVDIRLIEVGSRPELLLSDLITTSEDRLLESAGLFFIQASRDLFPLDLLQPIAVEMPVPAGLNNPLAVQLYSGSTASTRGFSSGQRFEWKPLGEKAIAVRKNGERKYFSFQIQEFNWFGCCSRLKRKIHTGMLSVRTICPAPQLDDQLVVLMSAHGQALAHMFPAGQKFTLFNVPMRTPLHVVALGLREGQFYFGQEALERPSSQLIHLRIEPLSESELLNAIAQL